MKFLPLIVLTVLIIVDKILRKKSPRAWWAMQLPGNILVTCFSIVYIAAMILGAAEVMRSGVDMAD